MITETLVNQARDGDKDSFIRLFESMELDMYKMARSMLLRDQDCQDVMQETTLKAYQSIDSLQKPEYFKTWVFRILINECNALLRKQQRRNETITDDHENNAVECATLAQEYEHIELYEAIEELDVSLRMVVSLYYFQDITVKEIASILNLSETAVKSRLYRARNLLAQALYITPNKERKMEQLAELEKSLKKESKLLDKITEVPKNIRDNQQQTYAQLEKKSLTSPTLHIRRKKIRYTAGTATAALTLGVIVFCSGFVSPVMADKLSQIPVIGSIFERSNDQGLRAASHLGLVQDTNSQDTHDGVTVRASDVIYDGIRLSLGLQREGRSFEGSFQGVQLDADGQPLENGKGGVVWNPENTMGQGRVAEVLIDGKPMNPDKSDPDAFKRSIGYTMSTGPDQDSMILTFANNNAVEHGVALPDEFMMSLTMEITGIHEPFQIDVPVKKDTSHTSVYNPGLTKLHEHLAITVNKVTVSPATTLIQITTQNEGTISDAYLNDQKALALDHEFYDDQGNELKFVGAQGWVDDDSSPTHYKQVQDYLNGPISENVKYLVVKTLKYKVDANGNSVVDKQGDFVKENIPELEFKIPLQK